MRPCTVMDDNLYCVYLMPYKRNRRVAWYCGYCRLDRVATREKEHLTRDKRAYTGELRVVNVQLGGHDNLHQLLIAGKFNFTPIVGRKEAMAAERFVKALHTIVKKYAYEIGKNTSWFTSGGKCYVFYNTITSIRNNPWLYFDTCQTFDDQVAGLGKRALEPRFLRIACKVCPHQIDDHGSSCSECCPVERCAQKLELTTKGEADLVVNEMLGTDDTMACKDDDDVLYKGE